MTTNKTSKPRRKPTRTVKRCSTLRVADADTRTIAAAHVYPGHRASVAQLLLTAVEHVGTDETKVRDFLTTSYPRHDALMSPVTFRVAFEVAKKKDAARKEGKGDTVTLPTNKELAELVRQTPEATAMRKEGVRRERERRAKPRTPKTVQKAYTVLDTLTSKDRLTEAERDAGGKAILNILKHQKREKTAEKPKTALAPLTIFNPETAPPITGRKPRTEKKTEFVSVEFFTPETIGWETTGVLTAEEIRDGMNAGTVFVGRNGDLWADVNGEEVCVAETNDPPRFEFDLNTFEVHDD